MTKHLFSRAFGSLAAALALSLGALLYPGTADAHALWINMTDYHPAFDTEKALAKTKLYLGWGHHFPVDGYVSEDEFNRIWLTTPDGEEKTIKLETTGFAASELKLAEEGLYLIGVTRHASYNTKYRDAEGQTQSVKQDMTGLSDVLSSTYSQQFAKTLFCVGDRMAGAFDRPLGQTLEIVPLVNPYQLGNNTGGDLPVRVLFEGEPAAHVKLSAKYEGFSQTDESSCATMTDRNGVAHIRITHWGPWVIKAGLTMEPRGDLAGRVMTENYYASLTFLIP